MRGKDSLSPLRGQIRNLASSRVPAMILAALASEDNGLLALRQPIG